MSVNTSGLTLVIVGAIVKSTNSASLTHCSSGSSHTFEPALSGGDSTDTFNGFEQDDLKPSPKKGKGSLNTVQFGLQRRKHVRTYRCQQKNCNYSGKSLRELNIHHVGNHEKVYCSGCDKVFKTPSSMKRHAIVMGTYLMYVMFVMRGMRFRVNLVSIIWCITPYLPTIVCQRDVVDLSNCQMS